MPEMFAVPLAIAVTFLVICALFAWLTRDPRPARVPLARLADPAPLPGEFPGDLDRLLLVSDTLAASDALEREICRLCDVAEQEFGQA